jgi:hypothetical protein
MSSGKEKSCGQVHDGIFTARECAERHKRSSEDFGELAFAGINLWWGEKYSEHHGWNRNLGYVIGLKNDEAGINWRLDFDPKKGAHLNQSERIGSGKQWSKIYHPIVFTDRDPSHIQKYDNLFWVMYLWNRWTTCPVSSDQF